MVSPQGGPSPQQGGPSPRSSRNSPRQQQQASPRGSAPDQYLEAARIAVTAAGVAAGVGDGTAARAAAVGRAAGVVSIPSSIGALQRATQLQPHTSPRPALHMPRTAALSSPRISPRPASAASASTAILLAGAVIPSPPTAALPLAGAGRPQSLRRRSTTSPPAHPTAAAAMPPLPATPSPHGTSSSHHLPAASPRLTSPRELHSTSSGTNLLQPQAHGAAAAVTSSGGGGSYLLQLQRRIEALRETVASGDRQALQASWQALKGDLDQARALQSSGGGGTAGPQAVAEVLHQAEIQAVQIGQPEIRALRSEPRTVRETAGAAGGLSADEVPELDAACAPIHLAPKPAVPLPVLLDTQEAPFSDGYRVGPLLPDGPRLPEEEGEEEEEEEDASQSRIAASADDSAGPPAETLNTLAGGGGVGSLSPLPEVRLLAANPAFGLRRETVSPESSPRLARRWQGMGQGKWSVADEGEAAGVQQAVVTAVTNPIASQASE